MGAMVRATRAELAKWGADEWSNAFAEIAGGVSLKAICDERCWAFGEVIRTIREDKGEGGLLSRYEDALKGRAEYVHEECIPIADKSGDASLMVKERRLSAKVWDRARHGEQVKVAHTGLMPVLNIMVVGEDRLEEKVVEEVPAERVGFEPVTEI